MKAEKVNPPIEHIEKALDEFESYVGRKVEIGKQLDVAEEFMLNKKISEIDMFITVTLNIVSCSLAIILVFFSIPTLKGIFIYPLLVFGLSLVMLMFLIFYRRRKVDLLSVKLLENKILFIELLNKSDKLINEDRDLITK